MQMVSERLKAEAEEALKRSVGEKKGGCALASQNGKVYSGFYVQLDDGFTVYPADMALMAALGDGCTRFAAAYFCGEAFSKDSLKRLARFGDLLINAQRENKKITSTLKKLIFELGEE